MKIYLVTLETFYDFEQKTTHKVFDTEEKALAYVLEKFEKNKAEEPEYWDDENEEFIKEVELEDGYFCNYLDGSFMENSITCTTEELDVE